MKNYSSEVSRGVEVTALDYKESTYNATCLNVGCFSMLLNIVRNNKNLQNFEKLLVKDVPITEDIVLYGKRYGDAKVHKKVKLNPEKQDTIYATVFKRDFNGFCTRINNHAERHRRPKKFVISDILNANQTGIEMMAKSPKRQSFNQRVFYDWAKNIAVFDSVEMLKSTGNNALYITNGQIVSGRTEARENKSKSLDFRFIYTFKGKTFIIYVSHKYTEQSGGGQDAQYNEIRDFIVDGSTVEDANVCFISVTDGDYYIKCNTNIAGVSMNHIDSLNALYQFDNVKATNSASFVSVSVDMISEWLKNNFDYSEIESEIERLENIREVYKYVSVKF